MTSKTNPFFTSRKGKTIILVSIIMIAIIAGGYSYYSTTYTTNQTTTETQMQTATVRQGDLVIYASGTGTLITNAEAAFGFDTSGQVTQVNVKVGDQVKVGQTIAELSNTSIALSYEQAKRILAELTSPVAIATAKQNIATAEENLITQRESLEFLISPSVFVWGERLSEAQNALAMAQAEDNTNSTDTTKQKVKDAELAVKLAEYNVRSGQEVYPSYIKQNFTETTTDARTGEVKIKYYKDEEGNKYTKVYPPTQAEIDTARAAYELAKANLTEANYYLAALNGEEIPADATGSALSELKNAKETFLSAEEDLKNTQLIAPISGTVMSLDFSIGDMVSSSATAVTIADLNQPYLEVFLDESDWANISIGYDVEATFDILPEKTFTGKVTQVDPGLYSSGNTSVVRALVKLDTSNTFSLPLGTSASVDVIGGRAENAVLVPIDALHETNPGEYAVFVIENSKPQLRVIEVGIQDLLYAEVKSGLNPGEVVTTGITETQ